MNSQENGEQAIRRPATRPEKHGRKAILTLTALAVVAGLLFGALTWRKHSINGEAQAALVGEAGAETLVYRRTLLGGSDLVLNVQSASGSVSMVDMTRRLLKIAEALQGYDFNRVYLAHRGTEKFYLDGSYFKQLGEEREWQNPVFTIRTMPENVHNLDGTQAFGTWSGGFIGVMGGQMSDNADFHKKWWADDAISELPQ